MRFRTILLVVAILLLAGFVALNVDVLRPARQPRNDTSLPLLGGSCQFARSFFAAGSGRNA